MADNAKDQTKRFKDWLSLQKKANGENYTANTIVSYASSLSTAPRRLTGILLKTTNIYEIASSEIFKRERIIMENAVNFNEVNDKAGNRAFQYALKNYEDFLIHQEQQAILDPDDHSKLTAPISSLNEMEVIPMDKNIILYGPPGTGKTYNTVVYAVAIIENKALRTIYQEIETAGYEEGYKAILTRYHAYKNNEQIIFTTFHQSYGYEEFIEGIKPQLETVGDTENSGDNLSYQIKPGIFKKFCETAQNPIIQDQNEYGIGVDPTIWKVSLGGSRENYVRRDCLTNDRIRIGWDIYGEMITDETDFSADKGKNILSRFINEMSIGDIVLSLYDEKNIDAIGVITGDYEWLKDVNDYKRSRKVTWLIKDIRENIYELNGNTVMTLGSVYRLNRITLADTLKIVQKHSSALGTSVTENTNNYVFIIDEINRGNISKIFGELITLIEPSKRIGQMEEIKVKLPYSQIEFGVPDNVYILATMNTADRSIALIDTALRRRFQFSEILPNPQIFKDIKVEGIHITDMLSSMNSRIEVLYDREHTIGHAYFISLISMPTLENLSRIFKNTIIPLLQEYFCEDYLKIQLVLGDHNKGITEQFISAKQIDSKKLFGNTSLMDLDDEVVYFVNEQAFGNINSYFKIYSL